LILDAGRQGGGRGIVSTPHTYTHKSDLRGQTKNDSRKAENSEKSARAEQNKQFAKKLGKSNCNCKMGMGGEACGGLGIGGLSGAWHHNKVVDNGKHVNQKLWHKDKRK